MTLARAALGIALAALLAACGGRSLETRRPEPRPATPLLVVVVIDQLGASTFERHLDTLEPRGILRRAYEEGLAYRIRFEHASTITAPGHAAVFTGEPPRGSGIGNNAYFDRERGRYRRIFDDGTRPIEGLPQISASPDVLAAPTLADRLDAATRGEARIVALSVKDRGAIPGGGRSPDALLFYEAAIGRFTSSFAHPPELLEGLPLEVTEDRLAVWEPLDPDLYAARLGPDDADGEMAEHGMGVAFPHDPRATAAPYRAYPFTPAATDHLVELALALAERLELGEDAVPDLLSISISSTDYVGHQHGPMSWEYLDHLRRADRAITRLVEGLGGLDRVTVAITSDHGVAPMPPSGSARRIEPRTLAMAFESLLLTAFGEGPHVAGFVPPWLYLHPDEERFDEKVALLLAHAPAFDGIAAAFDVREAERLAASTDPLERAVGLSLPPDADFDLYLVTERGAHFGLGEGGTSHGGPYPEEREVPGLLIGAGVGRGTSVSPRSMRDFHHTLRALLGLPLDRDARVLPGLR